MIPITHGGGITFVLALKSTEVVQWSVVNVFMHFQFSVCQRSAKVAELLRVVVTDGVNHGGKSVIRSNLDIRSSFYDILGRYT